jgi:hypothetical protein
MSGYQAALIFSDECIKFSWNYPEFIGDWSGAKLGVSKPYV